MEIELYDGQQGASLSHLLKLLWSPDADLNARHLEWKYNQNPNPGSCIYVMRAGEAAVAMRGFQGARFVTGEGALTPRVMCTGDLVIAPEYRGRGAFTQIMTHALGDLRRRDVEFLLNFSAGPSVRLGSLAAGWGSTAPVQAYRRLEPAKAPKAWMSRVRARVSPVGKGWAPFTAIDRVTDIDGVAIAARPRADAMADLIRRVETDGRIRQMRDEAYFRWRFGSPRSTYRFFFLGSQTIDAYLMVQARVYPKHGHTIRIGDWVGVSSDARATVLRAALASLPRGTMEIWATSFTEKDRTRLREGGFVERTYRSAADGSPAVLTRPVASPIPPRPWSFGGQDILDIDNWNLRMLDSDGC